MLEDGHVLCGSLVDLAHIFVKPPEVELGGGGGARAVGGERRRWKGCEKAIEGVRIGPCDKGARRPSNGARRLSNGARRPSKVADAAEIIPVW